MSVLRKSLSHFRSPATALKKRISKTSKSKLMPNMRGYFNPAFVDEVRKNKTLRYYNTTRGAKQGHLRRLLSGFSLPQILNKYNFYPASIPPTRSTPMDKLPNELIIMIGRNLETQNDLASFMHTHRRPHFLLEDDLFKMNLKATNSLSSQHKNLEDYMDCVRSKHRIPWPINCLTSAVKYNDSLMLDHILSFGGTYIDVDSMIHTDALATAVAQDAPDVLEVLLPHLDPTHKCTYVKGTPMTVALKENNECILLSLIERVTSKDIVKVGPQFGHNNGASLLWGALERDMFRAVRFLLNREAPGNFVMGHILSSDLGETPEIGWAKRCKYFKILVEDMGMQVDSSNYRQGIRHYCDKTQSLFWCLGLDEFWATVGA